MVRVSSKPAPAAAHKASKACKVCKAYAHVSTVNEQKLHAAPLALVGHGIFDDGELLERFGDALLGILWQRIIFRVDHGSAC